METEEQPFILATPVLTGKDAERLIISSTSAPTTASIERNLFEYEILKKIRKER